MGEADEGIVLTDREREALAGLAEAIGDPWLAGQLAGVETGPPPAKARRRPWGRLLASGWIGLVLFVAGAVLAMATFMHSTIAAAAGLAVMGVGLWRALADHGARISARLRSRGGGPA
ncbi:MAG TPA: DUF3040 domain-containing protein [Acidimicrobiia bacterium]|nr:DUF3040 domain-containing protein [Acidimicrobiia bacterium]